ncbi:MAG: serine/threonine protein kinase, partial [Deltaproteobacteria bacterium]
MSSGPLSLPARFGRYELVDHIATGGMAEVFLARSFGVQGFQKHVVVKRLRPGLAQNPRMVQLFVQEARISAGLVHPNIAQIHELGTVRSGPVDSHYIAMEYVHGQDLTRVRRALHERGRTLPVDLALYCAVRVLRALAYAHERADAHGRPLGLVHRDVSPHNVLVSFQGEVKLVDFGIARLEGDVVQSQLPGGGKYAYMSPEQASGLPLDGRSDVFSAGILLWELLVGHRLFQHPDPDEKLRRVRAAEVLDPGLE